MLHFPSCKINIGLYVVNRRNDGYHNIESAFYPVSFLTDILEIVESENNCDNYFFSGLGFDVSKEQNLCFKVVELLRKNYTFPKIDLYLHKVVPMGAGLGGGSADAAKTLLMINSIFNLNISYDILKSYALELGSDCPFFIENKPQIGEGRGEILKPFLTNLSGKYLLVVKPNIHITTSQAYKNVVPNDSRISIEEILKKEIREWKTYLENDFEKSVFAQFPQIMELKATLYSMGAIYAQMSGSGAACYGIFSEKPKTYNIPSDWQCFVGRL